MRGWPPGRRAFERQAGAPQRRHHAQERTQHAQQNQQADQIRRQCRSRQANALALDAQAHGIAQAGMQLVQPGTQAGRCFGQPLQRPRQRAGGLLIAVQLQRAHQVHGDHHGRNDQRQGVGRYVAGADPARSGKAKSKNNIMKKSGHDVLLTGTKGLEQPLDRL